MSIVEKKSINLSRERMYSGLETARLLSIPYESLERYVQKGWLPETRNLAGGQHLFRESDLDHFRTCRADFQEEASKHRAYFALETAQILGIGLNEIPGLVAMGILPDRRMSAEARNEWMFYYEDLDRYRDWIIQERRAALQAPTRTREQTPVEEMKMETTTHPQEMSNHVESKEEKRQQNVKMIPESDRQETMHAATKGKWKNPTGQLYDLEDAARILGLASSAVMNYIQPSSSWRLPDRRAKRGDLPIFYQSDLDTFIAEREANGGSRRPKNKDVPSPVAVAPIEKEKNVIETVEEHPQSSALTLQPTTFPVTVNFNKKLLGLAGLLVHLSENEEALDIQAVQEREVKIEISLPGDKNSLTTQIHMELDLHVEPAIRVWDVWMSTPGFPASEAYQAIYKQGEYFVIHLETEPEAD